MKSIKLILVLLMTVAFPICLLAQQEDPQTTAARAQIAATTKALTTPLQPAVYRHSGPAVLNNLKVTPGATGTMTVKQLCDPNFHTGTVRNVPESMKQKVCAEYGIARVDCTGKKYEIDHLISLELGGTNDEKNLWPQPYFPKPGAKEKDVVENALHRAVCAKVNPLALADAQHSISTDWYKVYLDITPAARGLVGPGPDPIGPKGPSGPPK